MRSDVTSPFKLTRNNVTSLVNPQTLDPAKEGRVKADQSDVDEFVSNNGLHVYI